MLRNNDLTAVLGRWQKAGDKSRVERFTQSAGSKAFAAYQYAQQSDLAWVDASFIRLRNLSISYQFPEKWVGRMRLKSLQCYLHGENLVTITKYKGLDPETQTLSRLPVLRVVTGGIKFSL
jgi:hypothetical protein